MRDLPDHLNRHRPLRPDELPRHYRRIRFADAADLARERERELEGCREFDIDSWDPWIGHSPGPDEDYFSSREMLHRIAWELVFEKGVPIALAVPPEKWARMEALLAGRKEPEPLPKRRQPKPALLASRLRDRLKFVREKSAKDCGDLLRSEMRLQNTGQLGDLISLCEMRHPEEAASLHGAVTTMMLLTPFWVRPLSSWEMPNQNAVEAFDSLLAHLFVEYPVPRFLYEAWRIITRWELPTAKWIAWFVLLGQGVSLHRVSDVFGWKAPESLVAHLMGAPRTLTPFEACAWAEVHRLGGSPVEFRRIRAHPAFAIDVTEPLAEWDEEYGDIADWFIDGRAFSARFLKFWRETIPWLVRHRDQLNDDDATGILRWASECVRLAPEETPFSWRGRSPRGCLRHIALEREQWTIPFRNISWPSKGWDWEWRPSDEDRWSIRELTTGKALHMEGARMGHCVGRYADCCFAGKSAIFSLEHGGEPRLTIEVSPLHRTIAQMSGHLNRPPSEEESAVIERWNAEVLRARKTPRL